MDKVIQNLMDPSWWFTTFIVATIVNFLGNILQSIISDILSKFSNRYAKWRKEENIEREKHISLIASSQTLIVTELVRAAIFIILFLFLISACLGSYTVCIAAYTHNPFHRWFYWFICLTTGLGSIPVCLNAKRYWKNSMEARDRHRPA